MVPTDNLPDFDESSKSSFIFDAFIYSKDFNLHDSDFVIYQLDIVKLPPLVDTEKSLFLRIQQLKQCEQTNYFKNSLFIHRRIFDIIKIPVGSRATLRIIKQEFPTGTIKIFTNVVNLPAAVTEFKEYLSTQKAVFNPEIPFHISKNTVCSLEFNSKFLALNSDIIKRCKLVPEFSSKLAVCEDNKIEQCTKTCFCDIGNVDGVANAIKMVYESGDCSENVLVVGK